MDRNPDKMSLFDIYEMLEHTAIYLSGKTSEDHSQADALMIVACMWAKLAPPVDSLPRSRRAA